MDLKHLLIEAKQKVPAFLCELENENEKYLSIGGERFSYFLFLGSLMHDAVGILRRISLHLTQHCYELPDLTSVMTKFFVNFFCLKKIWS